MQRFEAGGVKLRAKDEAESVDELVIDQFAYSLHETIERICADSAEINGFSARFDGLVLLIDEADNASPNLNLGSMLKLLSEKLARLNCTRLVIGIAGLPSLRDVLHQSHPSSLRLFEEMMLDRLTDGEIDRVIDICLEDAAEQNGRPTTITDNARAFIRNLSQGYPHFVQQFGFCSFAADSDFNIDEQDFQVGAFGEAGALSQIGESYYRADFTAKSRTKVTAKCSGLWLSDSMTGGFLRHKFARNSRVNRRP